MDKYLFTSDRLGFRRWNEEDAEAFSQLNADSDVMEFMPKILSRKDSDAFLARIQDHFAEHDYGLYAACLLKDHSFIGYIGFQNVRFKIDFAPAVEIGYRTISAPWG